MSNATVQEKQVKLAPLKTSLIYLLIATVWFAGFQPLLIVRSPTLELPLYVGIGLYLVATAGVIYSLTKQALAAMQPLSRSSVETEQRLPANPTRIMTLIDSLPGITFSCTHDDQWSMQSLSQGCLALTEYSSKELLRQNFNQIVHPEDLPQVIATINRAIAIRQPYQVEYRICTKSGQEKWVWEKGSGVFDQQGNVLGIDGFITEVTEQKRAEQALLEQQQLLQLVLDNIPQQIFWKDTHSVYLGGNKTWLQTLGVSHLDEVIGKTDHDLPWILEAAERYRTQDQQVINQEVPKLRGTECKTLPSGQQIWLNFSKVPIQDAEGKVIGILGAMENITEHKRTEEELERSLSLLKATLESTAEGIIAISTEREIVCINQKFIDIWGIPDEILTCPDFDRRLGFIMEQFKDPVSAMKRVRELYQQPDAEIDDIVELKSGRFFERHSKPQRLGDKIIGRVWSFQEITARKQAEAALRRYADIFEHAELGLVIDNPDGKTLQLMNPAYAKMHGYRVDELQGQPIINLFPPEHQTEATEQIRLMDELGHHTFESQHVRRDGSIFPVHIDGTSIKDQDGNLIYRIVSVHDITERKEAELKLQTLNSELERQVQERTAQLQAQMQELKRVSNLKDDFLSTVSHELRTPMANMKMAIRMLAMSIQAAEAGDTDHHLITQPYWKKTQQYLQILESECDREISLINDLLDLQRLETASQSLELELIDLVEWLPQAIEPFRARTSTRQQSLQAQIASNLPPFLGDRILLERILAELLNNACKYSPPGGTIQVKLNAVQSIETASVSTLRLIVWNSGSHIPTYELTRIFDKFYRVPRSDPWKQGGTGLGLALVKKLVQQLNGEIWAESDTEETQFIVELPMHHSLKPTAGARQILEA